VKLVFTQCVIYNSVPFDLGLYHKLKTFDCSCFEPFLQRGPESWSGANVSYFRNISLSGPSLGPVPIWISARKERPIFQKYEVFQPAIGPVPIYGDQLIYQVAWGRSKLNLTGNRYILEMAVGDF